MTFYCYYHSPRKEPWGWSSPKPPSWGQQVGASISPSAHCIILVGRNASGGIRFPPPRPGRGGAEPTKGGREEKISTAPRVM